MEQQSRKWIGKTGGGKIGQKCLLFLLKKINVHFLYPVLFLIIPFYILFARKNFNSIMKYFKNCYNMKSFRAFWNAYMNHIVFGQIVLDKFALFAGNKSFLHTEVTNKKYLEKLTTENKGIIIASSHIGNFEAGGFILQTNETPINSLIYGGESFELQNKRNKILKSVNINPISVNPDMSHLFEIKKALENNEIVTIQCDRIYGSTKTIKNNFMGYEASFPLAPFKLAVQLDVPMVALFMMKKSYKKYHAYVVPLEISDTVSNNSEKANQLALSFINISEKILQQYPRQWFNFYDFWETE